MLGVGEVSVGFLHHVVSEAILKVMPTGFDHICNKVCVKLQNLPGHSQQVSWIFPISIFKTNIPSFPCPLQLEFGEAEIAHKLCLI